MPEKLSEKVLSWASILDPATKAQAVQAAEMPFVFSHIALMPDAHVGKGSTVGSVIPTRGAVMPSAVGVDIGCGMQAVRTTLKRHEIRDLNPLRREIHATIPQGIGKRGTNTLAYAEHTTERIDDLTEAAPFDPKQYAKDWQMQLGSLGAGNHFIEVDVDEEEFIWLTLHSGSRGVGNKFAVEYIAKAETLCQKWYSALPHRDLSFFPEGEEEYRDYLLGMSWAQHYARANRDEMMDRVLDALWIATDVSPEDAVQQRFDCHHNFATMEHHHGANVLLTRKGAVRAREGDVALIPGSMGSPSFVVAGKGSPAAYDSAPHGAGRTMGRNQARKVLNLEEQRSLMGDVVWGDTAALIDECPGAYKPIEVVMTDAADLVEIVHTLRPILNIKGV